MVRNQFEFFLPQREEVSKGDRDHEILWNIIYIYSKKSIWIFLATNLHDPKGKKYIKGIVITREYDECN